MINNVETASSDKKKEAVCFFEILVDHKNLVTMKI